MTGFDPEMIDSPSGARLALRVMQARGEARGIVMIHHGMAEHAGRYARFAEHLAARGFHVAAHDHRGHGLTTAPDAPRGVFAGRDGWDRVMEDAAFVRGHLSDRFGGLPVIVFGHSMGGVIAMNQAMDEHAELAGVAVWNANLALGGLIPLMRLLLTLEGLGKSKDAPSAWMDALTFSAWGRKVKDARTKFGWLSRLPAEVDRYVDDPACGFRPSISLWRDFTLGVERGEAADRLELMGRDLPVFLAAGGDDPATDGGKAVKTLSARLYNARFSRVTMREDPGGRHETLNDIGYPEAMDDFTVWAERIIAEGRWPEPSSPEPDPVSG